MEVNELAFAAVGPYPGEVRIDFDALGSHALFAIDGPTGSGKSTVIDAIAFALYADVAGSADSDKARMRSAYASASQETFVELVFTTAAGRFRVRRQPEYQRPKARGTGETTQKATSQLWREIAPGQWESVATSNPEVGAEVARIVGLSKDQFLQTVVLPQGKFATFLRAQSSDRQRLLETIFATDVYARVQDVLQEMRRAGEAGVDTAREALAKAEHALRVRLRATAYDPDAADTLVAAIGAVDIDDAGDALFTADLRPTIAADADPLPALVTCIAADAAAARTLAEEVVAALDQVRETVRRISAAEAAHVAVDEASAVLAKRLDAAAGARADLAIHALVLDTLMAGSGGSAGEQPCRDDVGDPAATAGRLNSLRGRLSEAGELAATVAKDEQRLGRLTRERASVVTEREAATALVQGTLPAQILAAAQDLVAASEAARTAADTAVARHRGLVQARIDGMAGELATGLRPHEPCPVCGSVEHPAPASPDAEPVLPEEVDAAHRAAERAQRAREQAAAARSVADSEVEQLRAVGVEVDALAPARTQQTLTALVERLDTARIQEQSLAQRILAIDEETERLTESVDAAKERLAAHAAPFASVAERIAAVDAAIKAVDLVASATQRAEQQRAVVASAAEVARAAAEAVADIDVDAERERAAATEARARAAALAAHDLTGLHDAVVAIAADIETARTDLAQVEADVLPVRRMAEAVAGRAPNTMKQELRAYVLQQMFDEVLLAANARLRGMLDGNFVLVEDEASRGNKKAGLGLAVRDMRTDSVRSAESLSGGETFCASLALALGLADTVRAHAGGVEIGMLVVDEGFGSLDPERLDDVLNELNALRAQGRNVGVISHVEDMKKAINDAIHVRPRADGRGSDLTVTWMT